MKMSKNIRPGSVSIVIPAHDSEGTLPLCLDAINASLMPPHEVIVVDDASTDNTSDIAHHYGATVIRLETRFQPGYCRNLGAAQASGDILIFLDSDVVLQPEALQNAVDSLNNDHIDAVVGVYSAQHRHAAVASHYKNLWIRYSYLRSRRSVDWIFGAVAAIRKDAFCRAGGFDHTLFMHKGGDLELGKRMAHERPSIVLTSTVEVEHLKKHTLLSLLKNDFERSQGFVQLAANLGQLGRSLRRGFVNVYPAFAYSALLSWVISLCLVFGLWITVFWWIGLVGAGLYFVLNVQFLAYYARQRGIAETPVVLGIMILDHLACGLGSLKGFSRWLLSR